MKLIYVLIILSMYCSAYGIGKKDIKTFEITLEIPKLINIETSVNKIQLISNYTGQYILRKCSINLCREEIENIIRLIPIYINIPEGVQVEIYPK